MYFLWRNAGYKISDWKICEEIKRAVSSTVTILHRRRNYAGFPLTTFQNNLKISTKRIRNLEGLLK
jgi:hypothetical protein